MLDPHVQAPKAPMPKLDFPKMSAAGQENTQKTCEVAHVSNQQQYQRMSSLAIAAGEGKAIEQVLEAGVFAQTTPGQHTGKSQIEI